MGKLDGERPQLHQQLTKEIHVTVLGQIVRDGWWHVTAAPRQCHVATDRSLCCT
jgi:hypothetical protein